MANFRVLDQDGNPVPITPTGSGFTLVVPPGVTSISVRDLHTFDLGSPQTFVINERTDPPGVIVVRGTVGPPRRSGE